MAELGHTVDHTATRRSSFVQYAYNQCHIVAAIAAIAAVGVSDIVDLRNNNAIIKTNLKRGKTPPKVGSQVEKRLLAVPAAANLMLAALWHQTSHTHFSGKLLQSSQAGSWAGASAANTSLSYAYDMADRI